MSERDLHERASALFLELHSTPIEQRERRLRHVAGDDERLLREVRSLLEHDIGGAGVSACTLSSPGTEACSTGAGDQPTSAAKSSIVNPQSLIDTPSRIGPYRVIRRIGRGGSGYVLLAEQDEPVRRRVAIKIVPHAAVSQEMAARFDVERRALERTDHPNIARILDAGRTDDGLPYLVMEYVEGVSITEYCRQRGLRLRERIGLMLDVADAVQHAHQRGVIHRDLKPGNILVSDAGPADGLKPVCRARAKVLDFGIAKPVAEALDFGAQSPPTGGFPLGTPAYMAPEQTGSGAVDTRADVHALGAVLYELACGRRPIDLSDDPIDSLRRVRESVPAPASRVRAQNAAMFADDAAPRAMLSDLDCILGRALEKSPERRYPTASAFADDLRRLLRHEPIVARPPTLRYRAARFVRRNRVLVAASLLVIAAVTAGLIGTTWGLIEARRQHREAMNQTEAQREINRFLTDDLLAAASPEEEGANITALNLLHRASGQIDRRFVGRPLAAAAVHHTLGISFTALGAFDDAERHLQRAIELRTAAAGPHAPDTLRSQIAAASLLAHRERLHEADAALVQVIARARLTLGPNDPALYAALNDLGSVRDTLDKGEDAVKLLEEALAGRVRLLGPRDRQVFASMNTLALAYDRIGQPEKSLKMLQDALRLAELVDDQPRMTLIELNHNIGVIYQDLNENEAAEPYLQRSADLAKDFLGPEDPSTLSIIANLAGLQAELGDTQEALDLLAGVIEVRTRLLGTNAYTTLTSRFAYWNAMWHGRRFDEAAEGYLAFLPDAAGALGEDHWFVVQTRAALALALLDAGRVPEALPYAEQAAAQFTALYGADHARTRNAVGTLKTIKERLAEAAPAEAP
jgi:eukaryotic-like serine/threonine-protein kinase